MARVQSINRLLVTAPSSNASKHARLERGLSIADMSDEVGLSFKLPYEFETLASPLTFCHLEVWCQAVGVPFADFVAIYWADEEAYAVAKEREADECE